MTNTASNPEINTTNSTTSQREEYLKNQIRLDNIAWWRVFWVLGTLSLAVAVPVGCWISKTSRAYETIGNLEITEAQRRTLEDYRRVMSELNLQIEDASEREFSIEDKPPTVHWIYIPLNKQKPQN